MNGLALEYLYEVLNDLVEHTPVTHTPLPLLPDKWIAASAMQKGVRRGNFSLILRALETLWEIDPRYARRRLATIAFEEVGLGNPDLVGATMIACSGNKYLSREKIYRAVSACAIALATSPKERSAEHIYTALSLHPDLELLRDRYAHKSTDQLVDIMIDTDRYLLERCIAAWYLAGTKRFAGGLMPVVTGDMGAFEWAIEQLDIPLWQPFVSAAGLRVTQCGLPIFWPVKLSQAALVAGKVGKADKGVQSDSRSIPPYLLDQFTRGGKAVIREMLKDDTQLTRWLKDKLPRKAWQTTVEMGLFYVSGDLLDREYFFKGSRKLRGMSIEADCSKAGLDVGDVPTLIRILADGINEIDERRMGYIAKVGW